jgi:hypothetical protein
MDGRSFGSSLCWAASFFALKLYADVFYQYRWLTPALPCVAEGLAATALLLCGCCRSKALSSTAARLYSFPSCVTGVLDAASILLGLSAAASLPGHTVLLAVISPDVIGTILSLRASQVSATKEGRRISAGLFCAHAAFPVACLLSFAILIVSASIESTSLSLKELRQSNGEAGCKTLVRVVSADADHRVSYSQEPCIFQQTDAVLVAALFTVLAVCARTCSNMYRRSVLAASVRFAIVEKAAFAAHGLLPDGAIILRHASVSADPCPAPDPQSYHLSSRLVSALCVLVSVPSAAALQAALFPRLPMFPTDLGSTIKSDAPYDPVPLDADGSWINWRWIQESLYAGLACVFEGGSVDADGSRPTWLFSSESVSPGSTSAFVCESGPVSTSTQCNLCVFVLPAFVGLVCTSFVAQRVRQLFAARSVSTFFPAYSVRGFLSGAEARDTLLAVPSVTPAKTGRPLSTAAAAAALQQFVSPVLTLSESEVGGRNETTRQGSTTATSGTSATAAGNSGVVMSADAKHRTVGCWPPYHVVSFGKGPLADIVRRDEYNAGHNVTASSNVPLSPIVHKSAPLSETIPVKGGRGLVGTALMTPLLTSSPFRAGTLTRAVSSSQAVHWPPISPMFRASAMALDVTASSTARLQKHRPFDRTTEAALSYCSSCLGEGVSVEIALLNVAFKVVFILTYIAALFYSAACPFSIQASPLRHPPGAGIGVADVIAFSVLLFASLVPLFIKCRIFAHFSDPAAVSGSIEANRSLNDAIVLDAVLSVAKTGLFDVISDLGVDGLGSNAGNAAVLASAMSRAEEAAAKNAAGVALRRKEKAQKCASARSSGLDSSDSDD